MAEHQEGRGEPALSRLISLLTCCVYLCCAYIVRAYVCCAVCVRVLCMCVVRSTFVRTMTTTGTTRCVCRDANYEYLVAYSGYRGSQVINTMQLHVKGGVLALHPRVARVQHIGKCGTHSKKKAVSVCVSVRVCVHVCVHYGSVTFTQHRDL